MAKVDMEQLKIKLEYLIRTEEHSISQINRRRTCPSSLTMMLLLCLSPMPRIKVATQ